MPPRPTTEQFSPHACAYDVRGQKVAEWGTAVQSAAYEYDDAGRLSAQTRRIYAYDKLGRPTTRQIDYPARQTAQEATFGYNQRSELTSAQVSGELYGYDYDNIGKTADGCKAGWTCAQHAPRRGEATRGCRRINRRLAFGGADYAVYTANELNQYTKVDTNGSDFTPEYDADGNQTLVQTGTGIWRVTYNAQNRAVKFEREDGNTVITCAYDYMGRRIWKKVTTDGTVTLHERYIYRNYLQIAAVDLLTNTTKHAILWDPTQPTATRPLAIQQGKKWHTYAWDLTKNITAIFTPTATLSTTYTYTPFGKVSANGDVEQPVQWSSEMHDSELGLVYYNYRYYNYTEGRWTRRDPLNISDSSRNLYLYCSNTPLYASDIKGLWSAPGWEGGQVGSSWGATRFNSSNIGINSCYSKCPANARVRKRGKCCEYRTGIAKEGYIPSTNGCGAEDGIKFPDSGKVFFIIALDRGYPADMSDIEYIKVEYEFDFLEACNKHDECYGGCGNSKSECDKQFLQDMLDSCSKNQSPNTVGACKNIARMYYDGVYILGGNGYEKAQDKACEWASCK